MQTSFLLSLVLPCLSTDVADISDVLFLPVDGGEDRACRGASSSDNNPAYYTVQETATIAACKDICATQTDCTGIEYSYLRCELWTYAGGISSLPLEGVWCLEVSAVTTTSTSTVSTSGPTLDDVTTTSPDASQNDTETDHHEEGELSSTSTTSKSGWRCSLGVCVSDEMSAGRIVKGTAPWTAATLLALFTAFGPAVRCM
eukprot:CAMPEP_0197623126 /NCGR_PEP_ID=MMETSP1338-20131121/3194_1 /TAXON_ID=43686 ORGANISM="Pelagodinium beii, Strain RCC1491" /NCGR_SAMPLE_ID=MMETSP1338 /ASSEMBLY_ACC=CAM_ASM_000754 /LENGTH=200 /DNA_ID=CAMNT_0043192993 /DNA_START=35 /DNA_END=637 /DNA_ORIENTATION=-